MTNAALVDRQVGRIRPSYGYYRQPNGWITVSPAADMDELTYSRKGWTRLAAYGRIEMTTPYAADHPLEPLFQQGGAKELPLEQIIQQGLYMAPIVPPACGQMLSQYHKAHRKACFDGAVPVHFPQLDGLHIEPAPCHFCDEVKPTEAARDQHEKVAHKEEKTELRSGEALATAMIKGLGVGQPRDLPAEATDLPPDAAALLKVLAGVGLNQRQKAALAEAGIEIEEATADGQA